MCCVARGCWSGEGANGGVTCGRQTPCDTIHCPKVLPRAKCAWYILEKPGVMSKGTKWNGRAEARVCQEYRTSFYTAGSSFPRGGQGFCFSRRLAHVPERLEVPCCHLKGGRSSSISFLRVTTSEVQLRLGGLGSSRLKDASLADFERALAPQYLQQTVVGPDDRTWLLSRGPRVLSKAFPRPLCEFLV